MRATKRHAEKLIRAYDKGGMGRALKYEWRKTSLIAKSLLVAGAGFLTAACGYQYINCNLDSDLDDHLLRSSVEQTERPQQTNNGFGDYQRRIKELLD